MSTEAFGETLQFITKVKLDELEKRRQAYAAHASKTVADAKARGEGDPITHLAALVEGMKAWPGAWSPDMNLVDMERYLEQARRDSGFPRTILQEWIHRAEAQIGFESTRYEYARLFGNLLTDWLQDKSARTDISVPIEGESTLTPDGFEKVNRKETLEQKEKLESLIFETKEIDVSALEAYLKDLFSSKEAEEALEKLRKRIKKFSEDLRKRTIQPSEVENVIKSVLQSDVLSDDKQATLKDFLRKPTIVKELASVLNMQLSSIKSWSWPQEGVLLEPRRHLNGKTRFFLDAEILTCLLLHYLGMIWSIEFKDNLKLLQSSRVWKLPPRTLTRVDHKRRDVFFGDTERDNSIDKLRRKFKQENFFMCQLPSSFTDTADVYKEDSSDSDDDLSDVFAEPKELDDQGPLFDTPVDLKQSLLHILSADIVMNKALHGKCTIVRTDLKWFGPSLPFATIITILRFFGMSEEDVQFMQAFLSCPIVFKDDPSGLVRTRKRGVPIAYMLKHYSTAQFAKADGLFLHRIHDDFWFWDSDASRCASAWTEMQRYAALAGLTFNAEKTGSVVIGTEEFHRDLPRGDVRWGFLRMDANANGQFVIDQAMLAATTSIFSWTQAYNKYMAFVVRNCEDALLSEPGNVQCSFADALARMLEAKFGVRAAEIPRGWYLWPNAAGGLEVKDPFVDLFLVLDGYKEKTPEEILKRAQAED
ncbi:hypothetical protein DFH11DRAFT_1546412 [Phellopilus nigrolimitatus]|nr:hypothetical protein DFH11DRAFT_1546412 [Phellopilus nigrolimitatus]